MGKKKGGDKAPPAEPEVLTITNDGPPAEGPYVEFSMLQLSGGLSAKDKGKKGATAGTNDLFVSFSFAEEGVIYSARTPVLPNVECTKSTVNFEDTYALAIPESLNYPFLIRLTCMDKDEKGNADEEIGHAAIKILDAEGEVEDVSMSPQGRVNLAWEVFNLDLEFVYEYVPPAPEPPRLIMPKQPTSEEARFLEEKVWPTLEPALERLLNAVKYHIDPADLAAIAGGMNNKEMHRVSRPELAKGFDPVAWLANYLDWYNPNSVPKFTDHSAAVFIQCAYRKMRAKQCLARLRQEFAERTAADELRTLKYVSATCIQAAYRGHCVRMSLQLGRTADFQLTRQVNA